MSNDDTIRRGVAAYYAAKLAQHGATPQGVDWNGAESQRLRHRQFLRLIERAPEASVLDLGCGFGDFLTFLRASGHRGAFTGYDVSSEMIDAARMQHGEAPDRRWYVGATPAEHTDFATASGIFNVKGNVSNDEWAAYVERTIAVLAQAGRRGFAFNILSLSSDPERRRDHLFYADPAAMLADCIARYGRSVAVLQDYGLYEFTVIVRHSAAD